MRRVGVLDTKNMTIVTILVLLGIMLFSGFAFQEYFNDPKVEFKEEPLDKNTELQIKPGEEYTYAYFLNDSSINITYQVAAGDNCTRIYLKESGGRRHVCLDRWGRDELDSDSALSDPTFLLFKPWMLALHPTWRWNTTMYVHYSDMPAAISENTYRVMRTEEFKNRTAYVVEFSSSKGISEYQWVDAEKRVLLKVIGKDYRVELV